MDNTSTYKDDPARYGAANEPPLSLSPEEMRLINVLRKQTKGMEVVRKIAGHPPWGEIGIVIKHNEFVLVWVREDTKLSDK